MLIKVCGLTNKENVCALLSSGADYFGFIDVPTSPRYIQNLSDACSPIPHTARVLVTQNAPLAEVALRAKSHSISHIQLHGEESPAYCGKLKEHGYEVWKAFSVVSEESLRIDAYKDVVKIALFDNKKGGSGEKFSWNLLSSYQGSIPFFLSGGIGPEDTSFPTHPKLIGFDINSRFESSPGIKNIDSVITFIKRVRSCPTM